MKILIKEGIVKKMVNRVLGYDLPDKIEMVTNYWEAHVIIRHKFIDKERFDKLLNLWGPMYWIKTPDKNKWLAQRRLGGEWFIYKNGDEIGEYRQRINEDELLDKLGIGFMGVKLQQIIDEFIEE